MLGYHFSCIPIIIIAAPDDFNETTSMMLGLDRSKTNAFLSISITDDVLAEGVESFQIFLSLTGTNLPSITVNPNTTTVRIEDDDCKYIYIHSFNSRQAAVQCRRESWFRSGILTFSQSLSLGLRWRSITFLNQMAL